MQPNPSKEVYSEPLVIKHDALTKLTGEKGYNGKAAEKSDETMD